MSQWPAPALLDRHSFAAFRVRLLPPALDPSAFVPVTVAPARAAPPPCCRSAARQPPSVAVQAESAVVAAQAILERKKTGKGRARTSWGPAPTEARPQPHRRDLGRPFSLELALRIRPGRCGSASTTAWPSLLPSPPALSAVRRSSSRPWTKPARPSSRTCPISPAAAAAARAAASANQHQAAVPSLRLRRANYRQHSSQGGMATVAHSRMGTSLH